MQLRLCDSWSKHISQLTRPRFCLLFYMIGVTAWSKNGRAIFFFCKVLTVIISIGDWKTNDNHELL